MHPEKCKVFYFSGTGNSIYIANRLKQELGAQIYGMASFKGTETITVNAEMVGLVFPVYFMDTPGFVKSFIKRLRIPSSIYVFSIIHCGNMAGATLRNLKSALAENGIILNTGHTLFLPDNSIFFYTKPEMVKPMLEEGERRLSEMISSLKAKQEISVAGSAASTLIPRMTEWFFEQVLGERRKKVNREVCTRCGLCAKLCPVNCISYNDGYPVWKKTCVKCFACIHWCPMRAISFGRLRVSDKTAYRHPECCVKEIEMQRNTK